MKVLVLNADYTCHDIWSWKKAMTKLFQKNNISIVEKSDFNIRDGKGNVYNVPSVIVLNQYVTNTNKTAPFSRINVYTRDKLRCMYCGYKFPNHKLTIDHVIPKSLFKKMKIHIKCNSYENVVTCCGPCNRKKGDRTPEQADMPLLEKPKNVTRSQAFANKIRLLDYKTEWMTYLK